MPSDIVSSLASRAEADLRENILPYWMRVAPDPSGVGFVGEVRYGEEVNPQAPRGCLLASRILWTWSAAHLRWPEGGYLEMARLAYDDLVNRFHDKEHGGYFWSIHPDGRPLDANKYVYGQAFAIYALSEFHCASGSSDALDDATALYRLLDIHARDRTNGGFFERFTPDWIRMDPVAVAAVNMDRGTKSQNTHLHLMEAFTNLLRVWPDPGLRQAQHEVVGLMLKRVLNKETWHLHLFFDDAWNVRSTGVSYGHDIEAAWLMLQAAEQLGDGAQIELARRASVEIARATLAVGIDRDGALYTEGEPDGPTDRTRVWWSQAEGLVGFLNAWQVSGDDRYLEAADKLWTFIEDKMIDQKNGGWFKFISADGEVLPENKIDLWTCPYHNGRACMEMIDRLARKT
jgi:mannobiose 2-epimerase